jgi:hypothetical protein
LKYCGLSTSREIGHLASHFSELGPDFLKQLELSDLEDVISHKSLHISDEDSLLSVICNLGNDYFPLLSHVRFEWVSPEAIARLLNSIWIYDLTAPLWDALCRRLRLPVLTPLTKPGRCQSYQVPYVPTHPFGGILSHMKSVCKGSLGTSGVLSITAIGTGRNQCHQVVDHGWTDHWLSTNVANAWIQFDFLAGRISVTHYTIKSAANASHHLLHWSISGSNDAQTWTLLDRRDTDELNGRSIVKSFACSRGFEMPFRYIRLTQTGANSSSHNHLSVCNIEFFGTLVSQ